MTIRFACPGCQRTLNVPDQYAGRKSKCPGCAAAIMVPMANGAGNVMAAPNVSGPAGGSWLPPGVGQAPAVAPSAAVTTSPKAAPQWPAPAPSGGGGSIAPEWGSVATGLKLMRMATIIKILAIAFYFVGLIASALIFGAAMASVVQGSGQGQGSEPNNAAAGAGVLMLVVVFGVIAVYFLMLFIQYVLQVVGGSMALRVPPESGGKGLAIGVLLCILAPIFVVLIVGVANAIRMPILGLLAELGYVMIVLTEWVLFILFMHKVGTALDSAELRARAVNFGIWFGVNLASSLAGGCLIGIMIFMSFASLLGAFANTAAPDGTREAAQGFGAMAIVAVVVGVGTFVALLIIGLVTLIKYFGMMNAGIRTIRQRLAGAALA
jgi:hypothetical protein